ncbi:MAG: hypothetical protein AAF430_05275 [Myxococcota bacterium]
MRDRAVASGWLLRGSTLPETEPEDLEAVQAIKTGPGEYGLVVVADGHQPQRTSTLDQEDLDLVVALERSPDSSDDPDR